MKIAGVSTLTYRAKFRFETVKKDDGTALELELTALPWGWDSEFESEIGPRPVPPHRKIGESHGQPIFRECPDDADYLKRAAEWDAMQRTALVFLSLQGDRSMTWDTAPELRKSDARAYWRSIASEIKNSGWPSLEVSRLIVQCSQLAERAADGIEEKKQGFLATGG